MQTDDEFLATWAAAERDGDATTLDRLLTDDFVGVGPLGFVLTKPAWLARYRSGSLRHTRFDLDATLTREHGDSAVVTSRQNQEGTAQGHPIPEAARATLALTRHGDAWTLAGIQLGFIAGTRGAPPLPV